MAGSYVHELLLFAFLAMVIVYVVKLFYYDSIYAEMRKTSRCYLEKQIGSRGGQYKVVAFSPGNEPLYSVTYDLGQRTSQLECACKEGTSVQTFEKVKYYDMSNTAAPIQYADKSCQCKGGIYNPSQQKSVYFTGHPGLVRFMNSSGKVQDTTFFDAAYDRLVSI